MIYIIYLQSVKVGAHYIENMEGDDSLFLQFMVEAGVENRGRCTDHEINCKSNINPENTLTHYKKLQSVLKAATRYSKRMYDR